MTEILKDRALMFSADDGFWTAVNDEGTGPYLTDGLFSLTEGKVYTIIINGTTYTGEAGTATVTGIGDVVGIGNAGALTGGEGNGDPYAAGFTQASENGSAFIFMWFDTATAAEAYTISLYEGVEEESNVVLAEQTFPFTKNTSDDIHCSGTVRLDLPTIVLEADTIYTVLWDGDAFQCTAETGTYMEIPVVLIGNKNIDPELVADTSTNDPTIPFLIGTSPENQLDLIETLETEETHTIAIYKGALEEEEPETPIDPEEPTEPEVVAPEQVNLSLYDRNGNTVIYSGIKTVTFNTDVEGTTATFSLGTAPDETTVVLDLKEGDQVVQNTETGLIKKAVIQKPEDLKPENIKKGAEIAGVEGTMIGTGVSKEVELNFTDDTQIVEPDPETLLGEVIIHKPDTLVPEHIIDGINIAGVSGAYKGIDIGAIATRTISGPAIDENVTSVGANAFYGMSQITEVAFPNCTSVAFGAFQNCSAVSQVSIPLVNSLTYSVFDGCKALEQITLGCNSNFYTTVNANTFQGCTMLSEIKYVYSSSYVDGWVVADQKNRAFMHCTQLRSIRLLGKGGVYNPNSAGIGSWCFTGCTNLSSITISGTLGMYRTDLANVSTSFEIGYCAFQNCANLTTISFTLGGSVGFAVDSYAFSGCSKLQDVWLNFTSIPASSSSRWMLLGSYAFDGTPMSLSTLTGSYGKIHVTKNAYAYLRTASGWKAYSARMVSY